MKKIFLLLLAMAGCSSWTYKGPPGNIPIVDFHTRRYLDSTTNPYRPTWAMWPVLNITNPTTLPIQVDIDCVSEPYGVMGAEYLNYTIPPKTTQTFGLNQYDETCYVTWRF